MLDKLKRNKLLVLMLLPLVLISCGRRHVYNTEILCPNGLRILVRFASLEQVKAGIDKSYNNKKKYGTHENYTIVGFGYQKSFKIEKLPPEEAVKCSLHQMELSPDDKDYKLSKYYM